MGTDEAQDGKSHNHRCVQKYQRGHFVVDAVSCSLCRLWFERDQQRENLQRRGGAVVRRRRRSLAERRDTQLPDGRVAARQDFTATHQLQASV